MNKYPKLNKETPIMTGYPLLDIMIQKAQPKMHSLLFGIDGENPLEKRIMNSVVSAIRSGTGSALGLLVL